MEGTPVNKTNTNSYTFIFSVVMVVIVGSVLAYAATSLQPLQYENMRQDKMQSILATVGIQVERSEAQEAYEEFIIEELVLSNDGEVKEGIEAFDIDLAKELDKIPDDQNFPLYIAEVEGEKYYIIPLRGAGLWNAIFGYVALKDDVNTIKGATFDHLGETPGLGAEITQEWFRKRFEEEKIFDGEGNFIGVSVVKGYSDPSKDDNKVDGISGATITGDGVSNMISERLRHYLPYFKTQTDMEVEVGNEVANN